MPTNNPFIDSTAMTPGMDVAPGRIEITEPKFGEDVVKEDLVDAESRRVVGIADNKLPLDETRLSIAQGVGQEKARKGRRAIQIGLSASNPFMSVPYVDQAWTDLTAAALDSVVGVASGTLTFIDRALNPDKTDISVLDEAAAELSGFGGQLRADKQIPDLAYDIASGATSLGTQVAAYYAGGPFLSLLTSMSYGMSAGGDAALNMEDKIDPETGLPLATPSEIRNRMFGNAVVNMILEHAGVEGVMLGGKAVNKVAPRAIKGISKSVDRIAEIVGPRIMPIIGGSLSEGWTEGMQAMLQTVIENSIDPNAESFTPENISDWLYQAMIGAIVGGGGAHVVAAREQSLFDQLKGLPPEAQAQAISDIMTKNAKLLQEIRDPHTLEDDQIAKMGEIIGMTKDELTSLLENDVMTYHQQKLAEAPEKENFKKPRRVKRPPIPEAVQEGDFISDPRSIRRLGAGEKFGEEVEQRDPTFEITGKGELGKDPAKVLQMMRESIPGYGEDEDVDVDPVIEHVTTDLEGVLAGGVLSRQILRQRNTKSAGRTGQFQDISGKTEEGDPTRNLLKSIAERRKAEEAAEPAGLGGGYTDEGASRVSVTYWSGRSEIVERDLKWIVREIVSNRVRPSAIIDYIADKWQVYDWTDGTEGANLWREQVGELAKQNLGIEIGTDEETEFDRVFEAAFNEPDEMDSELFETYMDEAFADPESKYKLWQAVEGMAIGKLGSDEGRHPYMTAGIYAPFSSIARMREDNIGRVQLMIRKGAQVEMNETEQELRVKPEDIVVRPTKQFLSEGRIPRRSRGLVKPEDLKITETPIKVEGKQVGVEYLINGKAFNVRRIAASGKFQFEATDAETDKIVTRGANRPQVKRILAKLAVEGIKAGDPIIGPDTFTDRKTFRKIEEAESAEQAKKRTWVKSNAEQYLKAKARNPRAATLTAYKPEDLTQEAGVRIFRRPGDDSYFILNYAGKDENGKVVVDLAGLFSNSKTGGATHWAVQTALSEVPQGTPLTLDAFDGKLTERYRDEGFIEHGRVPFDPKYATPEMIASLKEEAYFKRTGKMPDVVFMHHAERPWNGVTEQERQAQEDADLDAAEASTWGTPQGYRRSAEEIIGDFAEYVPTPEELAYDAITLKEEAREKKIDEMLGTRSKTITGAFSENPKAGSRFRRKQRPDMPAIQNARVIGPGESLVAGSERPLYFLERAQGDRPHGPWTAVFHDPFVIAGVLDKEDFHDPKTGIMGRAEGLLKAFGGIRGFGRRFHRREVRPSDPKKLTRGLTGQERIGIAMSVLDGDAARKIAKNGAIQQDQASTEALTMEEMQEVARNLTKDEKFLLAHMTVHWNAQFAKMQAVARLLGRELVKRPFYYPNIGERQLTPAGEDLVQDPSAILKKVKGREDLAHAVLPDWFTQERSEVADSQRIRIDAFNVFLEQGRQATYWIHHAVPLANALEVLNNARFRDGVNRKFGRIEDNGAHKLLSSKTSPLVLLDALMRDTARNSTSSGGQDQILQTLRRRAGAGILGAKIGVMMKQPISYINGLIEYAYFQHALRTGGSPTWALARMAANTPYTLFRALHHLVGAGPQDEVAKLIEQVPVIRERLQGQGIDDTIDLMIEHARDKQIETLHSEGKKGQIRLAGRLVNEKVARLGFRGIILADHATLWSVADSIIRVGLADGLSPEEATAAAQRALEKTQPMSGPRYLPMSYRGSEYTRAILMFTGEINQAGNLIYQGMRKAFPQMSVDDKDKRDLIAFVMAVLAPVLGTMLSSVVDTAGRLITSPSDKDVAQNVGANAVRTIGTGLFGPAGSLLGNMLADQMFYDGAFGDSPAPAAIQAVTKTGKSVSGAIKKRDEGAYLRLVRDLNSLVGYATGKPLQGIMNFLIGWKDAIEDGSITPSDITAIGGASRWQRGVSANAKLGKDKLKAQ